ncbi:MAG: phospholipase D-like domain-containing protein [Parachlamydia sp.]|nr:phospholipase D-like domain-containing protein [Parachlamydia sp.]
MKTKRKNSAKLIYPILAALLTLSFYLVTEHFIQPSLPKSDQPPSLYFTPGQNDLQLTLSTAIDKAQHSVLLIIYTLTDRKIIHSLNERCAAGIPVRIVCNGKDSHKLKERLDPRIQLVRRFGPCLMHQKILVIDNRQVWIGSANMTGESLQLHSNLVTGMESPALASLIDEKASSMQEVGCNSRRFPHQEFLMGGQKLEMWFLPDNREAVNRIKSLIASAKKTIRVAMFTWTRRDFAQAIVEAYKRGVKVEVVLDYNQSKGASATIMKFLIQRGIAVRLGQGAGLFHHKFLWIDGTTLVNGSANWTGNGFTQNDDCFIVLHDLSEEQRKSMEELWKGVLQGSAPSKYR